MDTNTRLEIYKIAASCRAFEEEVFSRVKNKEIGFPVYLSAGQEFISATLAYVNKSQRPSIFAQHRAHSTYLSFGGDRDKLILELLGSAKGCTNGMGGSASIHGSDISMYGHDGLMGSQVPIGVGHCFATKRPTIIFMGDASAEEDYALGAMGWAATKKLPILFVVEDNNLSILTEKKVRRSWDMSKVAKGFGMESSDIYDSPDELCKYVITEKSGPRLINVETNRMFWHAGAGKDSDVTFDRLEHEKLKLESLGVSVSSIIETAKEEISERWNMLKR